MKTKLGVVIGLFFSFLSANTFAAPVGPKYSHEQERLHLNHVYFKNAPAPDFWALMPYYLPQHNNPSCSLASMAMVVNAARANQALTAADGLVTQKELLTKLNDPALTKKMEDAAHGIDLEALGKFTEKALLAYGFKNPQITVVHIDARDAATREKVHAALVKNESSDRNFILAVYLQGEFTGDPEGNVGQIAPVGAYDAQNKKVLILDPDRDWYEPYWVSEESFVNGMNTKNVEVNQNRGYVFVQLEQSK